MKKNSTIVIIDDSISVLRYMTITLNKLGYNKVITFKNPIDAIKNVPVLLPDLIVCDYIMFDMEGLTVIEKLRSKGVDCKYVLFTSFENGDLEPFCQSHNIIYMNKELNKDKIMEIIQCL